MLIVVGIILLLCLVIIHELGHFWAARRAGVEVEEFGLGFPPRAKVLTKKNGTKYTLNWLPLGGFVKLKGEHDSDRSSGSFGAAKLSDKVKIMTAGVVMNLLAAIFILTIVAAVGLPKIIDDQFTIASDTKVIQHDVVTSYISPDSPASRATNTYSEDSDGESLKLELGDEMKLIQSFSCGVDSSAEDLVNNPGLFADSKCLYRITDSDSLRQATSSLAECCNSEVVLTVERDDRLINLYTELLSKEEVEASKNTDSPKGYLGVVPSDYVVRRSTWSAPVTATVVTGQVIRETFRGLFSIVGDLFHGDTTTAKEQVTGVVGIGYVLSELSSQGFMSVLLLTAIISISLAVMNILPIPALDGGRLFVTLLFRAIKKPLTKNVEERIHGTGFALLMVLFVLITVLDVQRFIL